jgi:DNA-binding winged helix-turn-helix (wHTH) protein/Flp pilus assembly protein TadD
VEGNGLRETPVVQRDPVRRSPFQLAGFAVEPARNRLLYEGTAHVLEPRVMDVLCALAEYPDEVLSRRELTDLVWGTEFGADESLTRAISIIRGTFRRAGAVEEYVETIRKRGYRLCQTVTRQSKAPGEARVSVGPVRTAVSEVAAPPRRYSIAVLPPECRGSFPELASVADSIARDLTDQLARTPRLYVAAYEPVPPDGTDPHTSAAIGQARNVRYLACGAIDRSDEGIMLRIALVQCESRAQVWSRRMELPAVPPRSVLDTIVDDVATSILGEMQALEATARSREPNAAPDSDEIIETTDMLRSLYSRQRAEEIVEHLSGLLESDPDNARARAALAVQLAQNVVSRWSVTVKETSPAAREHVFPAQAAAPGDPDVVAAAGIVATMTGDCRTAVRLLTRAMTLDPNNPHVLAVLGWQLCYLNGDESGIDMIRTAERRAPHHPRLSLWAHYRGMCEVRLDRHEEAIAAFESSTDLNPNYHMPWVGQAVSLAYLHRDAAAKGCLERALQLAPGLQPEDWAGPPIASPYVYGKSLTMEGAWAHLRRTWPG